MTRHVMIERYDVMTSQNDVVVTKLLVNIDLVFLFETKMRLDQVSHKRSRGNIMLLILITIGGGPMVVWLRDWPETEGSPVRFPRPPTFWLIALDKLLTFWCPCSPSSVNWYQLASGLGWDTVSINATQSHWDWPTGCMQSRNMLKKWIILNSLISKTNVWSNPCSI